MASLSRALSPFRYDMKCGVCWEDESIAWECSHPGCVHAMCAGCAESYWCGDDVCDAVCLNRAHRVPWDQVLEALPKKGVRNLVSAMANRTFDEQGARFNSIIVEGEARERRKRMREETQGIDDEIRRLRVRRDEIVKRADADVSEIRTNGRAIRCPREGCNGSIKTDGICFSCNLPSCRQCACAIDGDASAHVCRDEDRLSVKEIYSSCTSCPACAAPIYKTEGCDHMFCTVCKTSYNMPDMRTMHNAFGNPHFDQYVSTLASNDRSGVMGDIELYGTGGPHVYLWRSRSGVNSKMRAVTRVLNTFTNRAVHEISQYAEGHEASSFIRKMSRKYVENGIDREGFVASLERRIGSHRARDAVNAVVREYIRGAQAVAEAAARRSDSSSSDDEGVRFTHRFRFVVCLGEDEVRSICNLFMDTFRRASAIMESCKLRMKHPMDIARFVPDMYSIRAIKEVMDLDVEPIDAIRGVERTSNAHGENDWRPIRAQIVEDEDVGAEWW